MIYENARYINHPFTGEVTGIAVTKDGLQSFVPISPLNNDYQNIMKLVEEGKLTIQPAEDINNQNS